jgi:hypothetical protein
VELVPFAVRAPREATAASVPTAEELRGASTRSRCGPRGSSHEGGSHATGGDARRTRGGRAGSPCEKGAATDVRTVPARRNRFGEWSMSC